MMETTNLCPVCCVDHAQHPDAEGVRQIIGMVSRCAEKRGHHAFGARLHELQELGDWEAASNEAFQLCRLIDEGSWTPEEEAWEEWLINSTNVRADQWLVQLGGAAVCAWPTYNSADEDPGNLEAYWNAFLDVVHGVLEEKAVLVFGHSKAQSRRQASDFAAHKDD